jgi:hypothetical protein
MKRLFLDDERFPPGDGDGWAIVRSFEEACAWVEAEGFPDFVSFDNDLGPGQREGWEFAQWLIERDLDTGCMPDGFSYYAHSRNPVRQTDIGARLDRYMVHRAYKKAGHSNPGAG